jgi:dUTP pyrophosphatase
MSCKRMPPVKIINKSNNLLPEYATAGSAGMDLRANLSDAVVLRPGVRMVVPTGLFMAIPKGYEMQVRPRSGMAYKYGITVLNSPGTIDSDYRGDIGVILINLSNDTFTVRNGDRIAQAVFSKYEKAVFLEADSLEETKRGAGGFGSTGKV